MRAFPLQTLSTMAIPGPIAMAPELSAEVGHFGHVRAVVTVPAAGTTTGGVVRLQTAAHRFADAFYNVGTPTSVSLDTPGVTVVELDGAHARYLRWSADATMTGNATFQIDVVGVRETQVRYLTLQDLTTESAADVALRVQQAFECGPYARIVAVARFVDTPVTGSIELQHAAVREEASFVATGITLSGAGVSGTKLDRLLRFLRWKTSSNWSGTGKFSIDLVCREGF